MLVHSNIKRRATNVKLNNRDNNLELEFFVAEEPVPILSEIGIFIPLPLKRPFNSFDYAQVCRGTRSYIYHQASEGKTVGYRVSVIRIEQEKMYKSKLYPRHERWRKENDFGKSAWACWTLG